MSGELWEEQKSIQTKNPTPAEAEVGLPILNQQPENMRTYLLRITSTVIDSK